MSINRGQLRFSTSLLECNLFFPAYFISLSALAAMELLTLKNIINMNYMAITQRKRKNAPYPVSYCGPPELYWKSKTSLILSDQNLFISCIVTFKKIFLLFKQKHKLFSSTDLKLISWIRLNSAWFFLKNISGQSF